MQICADHPRYRHFYTGVTEVGLGLCCEAAARQALTRREPLRIVTLEDDGEAAACRGAASDPAGGAAALRRSDAPAGHAGGQLLARCGATLPREPWPAGPPSS